MSQIDTDVAIIGGGISGLAVADGLTTAGARVQLFEARPRLGGRIESVPAAGGIAELGATWFWDNEPRVQALIRSFDMRVHDQSETGDVLVMTPDGVTRYRRPWSTNSRRFSGGASQLIEGLAERLPVGIVHLDSPVSKIENFERYVNVQFEDRSIQARHAVVAVPPSLAVTNEVIDGADLEPELRDVATNVAVWMGGIIKALAIYDKPFWRADGLSGSASSQLGPMHEIHDISGVDGSPGVLFGFGQTRPDNPDLHPDAFITQLTTLFGRQASEPTDVIIRDWRQEQWTTPNVWPPSDRYDLFGHAALQRGAWNGKLFWSSTETASIAAGHIEGALEAAERTVASIINNGPR